MIIPSRLNVLATLLLGGFVISQAVGQTGTPPSTSYDETHSLWLMTTMNSDNCTASGKLIWRPGESERAPVLPLIVGDAYKIKVTSLNNKDNVLQWSGTWTWTEKGKRKCKWFFWCNRDDTEMHVNVDAPSGFIVGDTLKIQLSDEQDDRPNLIEINKNDIYKNIATRSKSVEITASFLQFAPPPNPKPHPSAVLQPPGLCAKILLPKVHVADFDIRIVRWYRADPR